MHLQHALMMYRKFASIFSRVEQCCAQWSEIHDQTCTYFSSVINNTSRLPLLQYEQHLPRRNNNNNNNNNNAHVTAAPTTASAVMKSIHEEEMTWGALRSLGPAFAAKAQAAMVKKLEILMTAWQNQMSALEQICNTLERIQAEAFQYYEKNLVNLTPYLQYHSNPFLERSYSAMMSTSRAHQINSNALDDDESTSTTIIHQILSSSPAVGYTEFFAPPSSSSSLDDADNDIIDAQQQQLAAAEALYENQNVIQTISDLAEYLTGIQDICKMFRSEYLFKKSILAKVEYFGGSTTATKQQRDEERDSSGNNYYNNNNLSALYYAYAVQPNIQLNQVYYLIHKAKNADR